MSLEPIELPGWEILEVLWKSSEPSIIKASSEGGVRGSSNLQIRYYLEFPNLTFGVSEFDKTVSEVEFLNLTFAVSEFEKRVAEV